MNEIDDELYSRILELSENGESLFDEGKIEAALLKYEQALELVPKPKNDWEASTWLYVAIGDCFFFLKDYSKSVNAFYNALNCPDGIGNAFIHLRLGQCQFELGQLSKAEDNLLRAYMAEGVDIFEEDDLKYLNFLGKKYDLETK